MRFITYHLPRNEYNAQRSLPIDVYVCSIEFSTDHEGASVRHHGFVHVVHVPF